MKNIGSIHMDKGRAQGWALMARGTGRYRSVTIHQRTVSVALASALVWVVLVEEAK